MATHTLQHYAAQVQDGVKALGIFCQDNGHPQPQLESIANDKGVLPTNAPSSIIETRQSLIDAATRILQIVSEPTQFIPHLAVQAQQISGLRWLCRFNVVSLVPFNSSISYTDLATAAKIPVNQLRTVVRMLICAGFFTETATQEVKHTRLSARFAQNEHLQTWAIFLAEDSIPMGLKLYEATSTWGETTSKTKTAFNLAFDTDKPFFEWLTSSPESTKKFAGYMKAVTATNGTAIQHLVTGYNWSQFDNCTIVDIGGSTGHASLALADKYSNMRFVVQDLPRVIEGIDKASVDESVRERIRFEAYDFFQPQLVTDADVYLLRQILHDWPDAEAADILKQICVVMKPETRLIIMDTVLPVPGSISLSQEAQLRVRDMTMMQAFNASERDMEGWKNLLWRADARLQLECVFIPPGSNLAIMEVRLK